MYHQIVRHLSETMDFTALEIEEFVSLLSEIHLPKKSFLVEPNDYVAYEYFVLSGCLKAYYLDESGDKHIIQFAIEDWWISDFEAFFKNEPAQLYIEAIEDSVLLGLHRDTLEELYIRIPKFERFFRIKTTNAFVTLRARVLEILQKSTADRYLNFCKTYPNIEQRVTKHHIANYLGIQPESLSRIRKELQLH